MIDEANAALRAKGYNPRELEIFPVSEHLGHGLALLKGRKIVSPLRDTEETMLRLVHECVPPREELGDRALVPRELRACLAGLQ